MSDAGRAIKLVVSGRYTKQELLLPGEEADLLVTGLSASRNPHKILFCDLLNKRVKVLRLRTGRVRTLFRSDWFVCTVRWMRSAAMLAIMDNKGEGSMPAMIGFACECVTRRKQLEIVY